MSIVDPTKEQKDLSLPSYLTPATESDSSMGGLSEMRDVTSLAYAKMIQKSAKDELLKVFDAGDFILTPQMVKIVSKGEKFHFTPVYGYSEYSKTNPYGKEPFVIEKTLDPESDVARRAISRDPKVREEPHPDSDKPITYNEHFNFVIVLHDHDEEIAEGTPIVISLYKGEWKRGDAFRQLLKARRKFHDNICACRFQATSAQHSNPQYTWWGLDISNPEDGQGWLPEEQYKSLLNLQEEIAKSYRTIDISYGDESTASDASGGKY